MRTTCKAVLFAFAASFIYFSAVSQQVGKSIPNSTSPDGLIGFLEFRPPDYGTQKHPLIIFLHGVAERGNGTTQLGMVAYNSLPNTLAAGGVSMSFTYNGQTSSFVVLSPQLSASYAYWPSFYVSEMIKYAKANLSIDPNRIYVTGLSLGGGGVWRLISDAVTLDPSFDSQIAAVAPVCGTPEESDADFCRTVGANHLPIWSFHCMDDAVVSYTVPQHIQAVSLACGVTPVSKFTYYASGGHGGTWINAYDFGHITRTLADGTSYTFTQNLYEWFLSNTRSGTVTPPANTPPTVSVSAGQVITLPANSVTVSGTAAGTNGATISSYAWTQASGPSTATIVSPSSTSTNITGLVQGSYTFSFTAKDNNGLSTSATVSVTVNAAAVNTPPSVTTSGAQTITLPTSSVTLSGTGTGTNGATISSYAWTEASGPSTATIVSPASTSTNITGLVQGTYVFTFTAKDNHGLSSSGNVNVTVNPAPTGNQLPISNAGSDQTITGSSVTLDASASYDPGGSIVQYYWSQVSGPSTSVIGDNFAKLTTASNLVKGVYIYVLQVKDNSGAMAYSTKTVTVNPSAVNQPPVSNAGGDQTIILPTSSVTLDASASNDPDGSIAQYYWTQASGPSSSVIGDNFGKVTTATNLVKGVYTYVLQVKDNSGAMAYSTKTVTVNASTGNQSPVSNAGSDQTITQPTSSVSLDASASYDPDGSIIEYYWFQASGPSASVVGNNFSKITTAAGLVKGVYIYVLQVKDNLGLLAYSTKTVTVNAAGTRVADFGTTGATADAASLTTTNAVGFPAINGKLLSMYPNPVVNSTTIELNSTEADVKKIGLYNSAGVLIANYRWEAAKGKNLYSLKNITGLAKGLYFIHVTDSKGKITGTLKFVKS